MQHRPDSSDALDVEALVQLFESAAAGAELRQDVLAALGGAFSYLAAKGYLRRVAALDRWPSTRVRDGLRFWNFFRKLYWVDDGDRLRTKPRVAVDRAGRFWILSNRNYHRWRPSDSEWSEHGLAAHISRAFVQRASVVGGRDSELIREAALRLSALATGDAPQPPLGGTAPT